VGAKDKSGIVFYVHDAAGVKKALGLYSIDYPMHDFFRFLAFGAEVSARTRSQGQGL